MFQVIDLETGEDVTNECVSLKRDRKFMKKGSPQHMNFRNRVRRESKNKKRKK